MKVVGGGVKHYPAVDFARHLFGLLQKSQVQIRHLNVQIDEYKSQLANGKSDGWDFIDEADNHTDNSQNDSYDAINDVNLLQTDFLATKEQHEPLRKFFQAKYIKATFDYQAVNTSGYYDEAAIAIGDNYALMVKVMGQLSFAYQKNHTGVNFDLSKYSQKEGQLINRILRSFYEHALFSRYRYFKDSKKVNVTLQNASPIRQFFMGGWLEWYALAKTLDKVAHMQAKPKFHCARGVKIEFANGDKHELDVVILNQRNELYVIECKTGEFRHDLNKYLNLCKKMNLQTNHFSVMATDLTIVQAQSMTAMYGLNFITLDKMSAYINYIFD